MAGPAFDQWISKLGLHEVDEPGIGKPGEAHDKRKLPRSKLAPLLGPSEQVYVRYETFVLHLTVGRLIHFCEVLDAAPEEIIAPVAPNLWDESRAKAALLLASIEKLWTFDEETLRDVFSLLGHLNGSVKSYHGGNETGVSRAAFEDRQ